MNGTRRRRVLFWLVGLAIPAGLVWYLGTNIDRYRSLLQLSAGGTLALFLFSAAFPILNGLINTCMFRVLGADLTYREGYMVAASASLMNLLPVPGGLVTRGFYLKHRHGLDYSVYVSAQLAFFICSLAAYGLVGVAVLCYWALFQNATVPRVLFIVFGLMGASLAVLALPFGRFGARLSKLSRLRQVLDGWVLVGRNPRLLGQLLSLDGVALVCLAARYWFAFHMLSQDVTPSQVLLFASGTILTQLVTLAPNGLGVREAIVGGMASLLGFDTAASVAALGLDALVTLVVVLLTGSLSTIILGRRLAEQSDAAPE